MIHLRSLKWSKNIIMTRILFKRGYPNGKYCKGKDRAIKCSNNRVLFQCMKRVESVLNRPKLGRSDHLIGKFCIFALCLFTPRWLRSTDWRYKIVDCSLQINLWMIFTVSSRFQDGLSKSELFRVTVSLFSKTIDCIFTTWVRVLSEVN